MLRSSAYLLCKCNSDQYKLFGGDYRFFIKQGSIGDIGTFHADVFFFFFLFFYLILYVSVNNFSVMLEWVFLG